MAITANFYGINSILLSVNDDSVIKVADSKLTADSTGSNAIFATDGGTVYANNNTIVTSASNSRGLDATYGGTVIGNLLAISTAGDHSAALATDRGGGNISLTNSSLFTAGSGSPLLYSTGNVQVDQCERHRHRQPDRRYGRAQHHSHQKFSAYKRSHRQNRQCPSQTA